MPRKAAGGVAFAPGSEDSYVAEDPHDQSAPKIVDGKLVFTRQVTRRTKDGWTPEQLMAARNFGPALIGEEMHGAVQSYVKQTNGGQFGPALLGDSAKSQAAPTRNKDGKLVWADGTPVVAEA